MSFTAPAQRGAFIVLEGLDRAGKTTQVQLLAAALEAQGKRVRRLRFPGNYFCHYLLDIAVSVAFIET